MEAVPKIVISASGIVRGRVKAGVDSGVTGSLLVEYDAENVFNCHGVPAGRGLHDGTGRVNVAGPYFNSIGSLYRLPEIDGFYVRETEVAVMVGISQHHCLSLIPRGRVQVDFLQVLGRVPLDRLAGEVHMILYGPLSHQARKSADAVMGF